MSENVGVPYAVSVAIALVLWVGLTLSEHDRVKRGWGGHDARDVWNMVRVTPLMLVWPVVAAGMGVRGLVRLRAAAHEADRKRQVKR